MTAKYYLEAFFHARSQLGLDFFSVCHWVSQGLLNILKPLGFNFGG